MHELSIAQSLVETVLERTGNRRVTEVNLRIGKLSGVLPDALRFCFDVVADGTALAGSVLMITEPEGRARCRTCGSEFTVPDLILLCPCGSSDIEVISGRELMLASVELAPSETSAEVV